MNELIASGEVRRPAVGVSLLEVEPEDAEAAGLKEIRGAKVADFTDNNSPAKKAGIEVGDVITAVDGKPVEQVNTLQRIIRDYRVGQTANIEVMRFGQKKNFPVKLAQANTGAAEPMVANDEEGAGTSIESLPTKQNEKLGLTVSQIPASLAKQLNLPADAQSGLLIRDITQRGPSFQRFGRNEIIDGVLYPVRRDIKSIADLDQALAGLKSGQVVTLRLFSPDGRGGGASRTQSIRLP